MMSNPRLRPAETLGAFAVPLEGSVTAPKLGASGEVDDRPEVQQLLANLRASLPALEKLLRDCQGRWGYEDGIYRFYHNSFKVYALQQTTSAIVAALQSLAPHRELNEAFAAIVRGGTGKTFEPEHNRRWLRGTRPIVEAFFHALCCRVVAVRYGTQLPRRLRQLRPIADGHF